MNQTLEHEIKIKYRINDSRTAHKGKLEIKKIKPALDIVPMF